MLKNVLTGVSSRLTGYALRGYHEEDRAAASAFGTPVIDWWHAKGPEASLHLVATAIKGMETSAEISREIVGHLQVVDFSVPEPTRRPGQCHFSLDVAPDHRRRGIGGALYDQIEAFARLRAARTLYAAYIETDDAPAASFLGTRGFTPLERFHPSSLVIGAFDPERWEPALERVRNQGIRLATYAGVGDGPQNRRKLYELEQAAKFHQPFREVEPYVPDPFDAWEQAFLKRDPRSIFLAIDESGGGWIGVVTGLEWYFTGVHPDWCGRGIATALKVLCIAEAKRRGIVSMETENHEDNAAMLAVNRKLGFVFSVPELACLKRF